MRVDLKKQVTAEKRRSTEYNINDPPLNLKHESEALAEAGFSSVAVLKKWVATYTLKAIK